MILRPMSMADADFMLMLKNYPETRQFAITSHDEIQKEAHYKWLKNNLQYFQIIGDMWGAVRITPDGEISIWVDRQYWGTGIASFAIKHVYKKGMFAKIVTGNISSMRCFINAGFKPVSFNDNYYIFK